MKNYELSVWSHLDIQKAILRTSIDFDGQAYDIKFTQNVNGEEALTFSIPASLYNKTTGEFEDNPLITFVLNEEKIRLIRDKKLETESIHDFIVKSHTESRDGIARIIDVECKSYAIYELSRIGYTAEFTDETVGNINFWMDKILPFTKNAFSVTNTSGWNYEVNPSVLYENDKIIGYQDNGDETFSPIENVDPIEKQRIIPVSNSNVFNFIQDVAEKFSVWASFKYEYNSAYVVTGRKIIFTKEIEKDSLYSISYGVNSTGISKTTESTELATKVYIDAVESDLEYSGLMSFSEAPQNLMMENFLYNFNYYEERGLIPPERKTYAETTLAYSIRNENIKIKDWQSQKIAKEKELNDILAKIEFKQAEIAGSIELQRQYLNKRDEFSDSDITAPLTRYSVIDRGSYKYINLSSRKGIKRTGFLLYYNTDPLTQITSYNFVNDPVNTDFIIGIEIDDSINITMARAIYVYNQWDYYDGAKLLEEDRVIILNNEIATLELQKTNLEVDILSLENSISSSIETKNQLLDDFEHSIFYAIREANWKDSEYKLRKEFFYITPFTVTNTQENVAEAYILTQTLLGQDINNVVLSTIKIIRNNGQRYEYKQVLDYDVEFGTDGSVNSIIILPTESGAFKIEKLTSPETTLYSSSTNDSIRIELFLKNGSEVILTIPKTTSAKKYIRTAELELKNVLPSSIIVYAESDIPLVLNTDYSVSLEYEKVILTFKTTNAAFLSTSYSKFECYKNITLFFYYNDAVEVIERSSKPVVSYSISAIDLSSLPGFESFKPVVGQKILITDKELSFNNEYGFLSQIDFNLDNPEDTQLTISNYKTRFEDLFQRIAAATQQLELRGDAIERVLDTLPPTGYIEPEILKRSVQQNALTLANNTNNEVVWDSTGITLTDLSKTTQVPGQVRIIGGGIFLSNELDSTGSRVWRTGITGSGINASEITTGKINTAQITIWDGANARFLWNGNGLFAYDQNIDGTTNFNKYVKFNSDGLDFAIKNEYGASLSAVKLDWNGFSMNQSDGTNNRLQFGDLKDGTYGLILKNSSGSTTFRADSSGYLYVGPQGMQPGNGVEVNGAQQITSIGLAGITVFSGASAISGARTVFNSSGIYGYNASNVNTFYVRSSDGAAYFSGTVSGSAISGSTITGGTININSGRFDVNANGDVYARRLTIGTDGCDVEGNAYFDDGLHVDGSLSSRYYDGDINAIGHDNCGTSTWYWNSVWASDTSINSPSDRRLKKDIVSIINGVELILALNPIQYKWNEGTRDHYGLIAQEVKEAMTKVGIADAGIFLDTSIEGMQDGKEPFFGLRYGEFISPIIQTVQYLNNKIEQLEQRILTLENK